MTERPYTAPMSADELRRARRLLRLTQTQLSQVLGVSRNTIALWETPNPARQRPVTPVTARFIRHLIEDHLHAQ